MNCYRVPLVLNGHRKAFVVVGFDETDARNRTVELAETMGAAEVGEPVFIHETLMTRHRSAYETVVKERNAA